MKVAIFTETYFPFISGVVTHIKTLKDEPGARRGMRCSSSPPAPRPYAIMLKDGVLYCPAIPLQTHLRVWPVQPRQHPSACASFSDFDPDIIHIHTEFSMGIFAPVLPPAS